MKKFLSVIPRLHRVLHTAAAETAPDLAPQIPDHLVDEMLAGNCVLFVGAGFSAPAGFPGWKKLLLNTAEHGLEEGKISSELKELVGQLLAADWPAAHDLDQAAQLLDDHLSQDGEPVQEAMVNYLKRFLVPKTFPLPQQMERRLQLLELLPFASILTTNYNPLLKGVTPFDVDAPDAYRRTVRHEQTAVTDRYGVAYSTDTGLEYTPAGKPVIQIHGNLQSAESVVLTNEGYRRLLHGNASYATFLRSVLASRTVLFVGFSFSDSYLNELRSEIISMVGHGEHPLAYAIIDNKTQLECDYNLRHMSTEFLSYDTKGPAGWGGFDLIFEELASRVAARGHEESLTAAVANPSSPRSSTHALSRASSSK